MLIVKIEGKQTLEKDLKVLKKKWDKTKAMKELRERKEFTKKSVKNREVLNKATYRQKLKDND